MPQPRPHVQGLPPPRQHVLRHSGRPVGRAVRVAGLVVVQRRDGELDVPAGHLRLPGVGVRNAVADGEWRWREPASPL